MPRKYIIAYHEAAAPIMDPVTKFGGQPVWVGEPSWPLSRSYGTPMQFICQIALSADLFNGLEPRMAYLFSTDDYAHGYRAITSDPTYGESALILQPGGSWEGSTLSLREGPGLYRRIWTGDNWDPETGAGWDHTPSELAVELHPGEDPDAGAWDTYAQRAEARDAYFVALCEDKVGGVPVPTINNAKELAAYISGGWRLLLQLNAKDNEGGTGDLFFLNISYDGVGYAFISPDGRSGKFLWSR
jgi:hypothetical protein